MVVHVASFTITIITPSEPNPTIRVRSIVMRVDTRLLDVVMHGLLAFTEVALSGRETHLSWREQ